MSTSPGLRAHSTPAALDGQGNSDGVVVSLQLQGSTALQAVYTLPVTIGGSKPFSLQVDTGSSDLWVASSSCSSSACDAIGGDNLYNPSTSTQTGVDFNITYLNGQVNGPIVWDRVQVGGYRVDNQALAAATVVNNEPLSSSYQGILGLALPLNSVIASLIPPVTGNTPDGAAWASNLFSLTPVSSAPAARFLSLSLERPGSDRVPSLLGIGHHPSSLVSDPSQIQYSSLVGDREGTLYWKITVRAITVYVSGQARPVEIGNSVADGAFPTAILDSGIPVILTTSHIANGIYGALGIGPGADGNYYVPCATPLNMTITLDNRPEIPLHPLDLTSEPPDNNRAQFCIGMIQADDSAFYNPGGADIGDMILGVPFLRNTYTVMAYTTPNADGSFPNPGNSDYNSPQWINPALGLLALTNATVALQEFNTVRVLNLPLSSSSPGGNQTARPSSAITVGPKRLSIGITVLIVLVGFFSLCVGLFGLRWFLLRRKFGKEGNDDEDGDGEDIVMQQKKLVLRSVAAAATAAATASGGSSGQAGADDEESSMVGVGGLEKKSGSYSALVRSSRSFDEGRASGELLAEEVVDVSSERALVRSEDQVKERGVSLYTASSGRTRIGDDNNPTTTMVPTELGYGVGTGKLVDSVKPLDTPGSRPPSSPPPPHHHHASFQPYRPPSHECNGGVLLPLLAHHHQHHQHRHSQSFDLDGTGAGAGSPVSPRFFNGDEERGLESPVSATGSTRSMVGIGTAAAAVAHKWHTAHAGQFESLAFPRDSLWSAVSGGDGGGTTLVASPASMTDEEQRYAPSPSVTSPTSALFPAIRPDRPASTTTSSLPPPPLPPTPPVDVPAETSPSSQSRSPPLPPLPPLPPPSLSPSRSPSPSSSSSSSSLSLPLPSHDNRAGDRDSRSLPTTVSAPSPSFSSPSSSQKSIPSGAGNPSYAHAQPTLALAASGVVPSTAMDEFDPYAEFPLR